VKFSWQLAQDSIFNMESLLADLLGERLGRLVELPAYDRHRLLGAQRHRDRRVQPARPRLPPPRSSMTRSSTSFTPVDPAYRQSPKVRFMFNDLTLAALRKLKDGDGKYIWTMGDVRVGAPGSLLGYNYSINQAMATIATGNKTVLFGDFGKYWVRKVGAPVIGVLRERFWPDLGIAGLIRFDGELLDTAAVKYLVQA
jgi:predicted phage gp36 major capsid-like protein